jgi:hypothetical protein
MSVEPHIEPHVDKDTENWRDLNDVWTRLMGLADNFKIVTDTLNNTTVAVKPEVNRLLAELRTIPNPERIKDIADELFEIVSKLYVELNL